MYGGVKIIILIKTRTDGLNGGVGSQKYARIMPSALDLGLPIPHKKKKWTRSNVMIMTRYILYYIAVYFGRLPVVITINTDESTVKP